MATIKVNSAVMRDKANSFKTVSGSIKTCISEMTNEIDGMKAAWKGDSAEALVKSFKAFAANFEEVEGTINQYADFLNQAADDYDKLENASTQGAEGQPG